MGRIKQKKTCYYPDLESGSSFSCFSLRHTQRRAVRGQHPATPPPRRRLTHPHLASLTSRASNNRSCLSRGGQKTSR
ncbi:hypothetical protein E2C01_036243 [Portunus trituberculatus]|uniref:Uncharacterized protein n=1 Tax=Portunus trituberculatus TaxID=210409 RepID=A0A5B7FBK2_PORTR|nr:hypothetical protein [Portunus trituberculatus]